jgi:undecaprenyl pyrophosphate phosphatase UppP
MPHGLRRRFLVETVAGSITGCLAVVTLFWHDWIEAVFGVDPDRGNGSAEWLVVVALFIVTVILAVGARLEWRRAQLAETRL